MREIKFRAWDGEIMSEPTDNLSYIGDQFQNREDVVLMQYTGLKDKNGKEIYEGDVVSIDGTQMEVEYEASYARFTVTNQLNTVWGFDALDSTRPVNGIYQPNLEIIGNIYENPELLKD